MIEAILILLCVLCVLNIYVIGLLAVNLKSLGFKLKEIHCDVVAIYMEATKKNKC